MAGVSPANAFDAGVSPWRLILPHFDWLASQNDLDDWFCGLRDFVAGACEAQVLADRFVFPSTINMSIFRTRNAVDYLEDPMPVRFIVSPGGPVQVRLCYIPAGTKEPSRSWAMLPSEAIRIIATEFARSSDPQPPPPR